jgi:hypothetical protein
VVPWKLVSDCFACCLLRHAGFLLGLLFNFEVGGDMFLHNISWLSVDYLALYPKRKNSSMQCFCCKVQNTNGRIENITESWYMCNSIKAAGTIFLCHADDLGLWGMDMMRFEVLTEMVINIMIFWDVTPYSLVDGYQHFGETSCLHQPWRWRQYVPSKQLYLAIRQHGITTVIRMEDITR